MNFDDYEQLDTNNIGTNMTAGALAGIMEHLVMYPIDSVKVMSTNLHTFSSHMTIFYGQIIIEKKINLQRLHHRIFR